MILLGVKFGNFTQSPISSFAIDQYSDGPSSSAKSSLTSFSRCYFSSYFIWMSTCAKYVPVSAIKSTIIRQLSK